MTHPLKSQTIQMIEETAVLSVATSINITTMGDRAAAVRDILGIMIEMIEMIGTTEMIEVAAIIKVILIKTSQQDIELTKYFLGGPGNSSGNYNKRSGGGNRPNNSNNSNQQSRSSNQQSYNKPSFPPGSTPTQQPSQPPTAQPTRSMNPNAPVFKVGGPIMRAPAPVKELIVDVDKVVAAMKPVAGNYAKGDITLSVALEKLEPLKLGQKALTEIYNMVLDKDDKGRWSLTELFSECIAKQQVCNFCNHELLNESSKLFFF